MYVTIVINEKQAINLRVGNVGKTGERSKRGARGRKRKGASDVMVS